MSKGPGKRQRLIMDKLITLGEFEYFPLVSLLPARHKAKEYQALNRAAKILSNTGKVNLSYTSDYGRYLSIHHLGTKIITVPNPETGINPETGFYHRPIIDECVSVYSETENIKYTLTENLLSKLAVVKGGKQ